jgi:hypothetical protein
MEATLITTKRRVQIFMTGVAPLLVLGIILAMAAQFGLDVVSLFTKVDKRDAANYVVVTKVFGVTVNSRPATQADLVEEDSVMRIVKIAVLVGSFIIISGSLLMCYASVTGKPPSVLSWCDRQLGSVRKAFPNLG